MDHPKSPTFCGVATMMQAPLDQPGKYVSKNEKAFAKLAAYLPVMQTAEEGLKVGLLHDKFFSMKTGEPSAYIDCRHKLTGIGKVSDRFIFTIRNGQLTLVEHLSRRVIN